MAPEHIAPIVARVLESNPFDVFSEPIYAPIVRKVEGPGWYVQDVAKAMVSARAHQLLLVYCRTWDESMVAGSKIEEQMAGVHENYAPLVAEYDRWMDYFERAAVPMFRYDYRKDPTAKYTTEYIKKFWENARG